MAGHNYENYFVYAMIEEGINQNKTFELFMEGEECFYPFDDAILCMIHQNEDGQKVLELYQLKHKESEKNAEKAVSANAMLERSTTGSKKGPFYLRKYLLVITHGYKIISYVRYLQTY